VSGKSGNGKSNGNGVGRPSRYRPEYAEQVFRLALLGLTDAELARFFDIDEATCNRWKHAYPEFRESLKAGREDADTRVTERLYRRALGYSHEAVKIFADPKTGTHMEVPYIEHYPPDTTACIFWLKNRRPVQWRDRRDVELTGKDGTVLPLSRDRMLVILAGIDQARSIDHLLTHPDVDASPGIDTD
jgi:hypothetical protein